MITPARLLPTLVVIGGMAVSCQGDIIWSDLGATLAHETGSGADIRGGAVKRDASARDTLYFKFHVNPISDAGTEPYFAAFELYEGNAERLAVGNAWNGWAYGAFNVADAPKPHFYIFETANTNNTEANYGIDLHSSKPTAGFDYGTAAGARALNGRLFLRCNTRRMAKMW